MKRRAYQVEGLRGARRHRSFFFLWSRQRGKSTTLAEAALDEMLGNRGRLITYASASLLMGREIVFKESQVLQTALGAMSAQAREAGMKFETADSKTHKALTNISADDFADMFETQRLLFQVWHDKTTCSRTQVIAPNPATARGWSGTVFLDEFGFIRDFRDLWEAVEPIISSNQDFRFIGATTPPKDDAHYSYELTSPVMGTEFPINPAGNWYTSEAGELVHRVDIHDSFAAGVKIYDRRTGKEITPQEHFKRAEDKDAWRRNYGIQHVLGGAAAVGLLELQTAQQRGIGQCALFIIDSEEDFAAALVHLREKLRAEANIGLGFDIATTEKETSNPSVLVVAEEKGAEICVRAVLVWKTKDPAIATDRIGRTIACIRSRDTRPRRLCVDATNERYFAAAIAKQFGEQLPVELVVASDGINVPGRDEPTNMKTLQGDLLVSCLNDNRMTLPPERYLREDFRLVRKVGGRFVCTPDAEGRHGDTFDGTKQALWALKARTEYSGELV